MTKLQVNQVIKLKGKEELYNFKTLQTFNLAYASIKTLLQN